MCERVGSISGIDAGAAPTRSSAIARSGGHCPGNAGRDVWCRARRGQQTGVGGRPSSQGETMVGPSFVFRWRASVPTASIGRCAFRCPRPSRRRAGVGRARSSRPSCAPGWKARSGRSGSNATSCARGRRSGGRTPRAASSGPSRTRRAAGSRRGFSSCSAVSCRSGSCRWLPSTASAGCSCCPTRVRCSASSTPTSTAGATSWASGRSSSASC